MYQNNTDKFARLHAIASGQTTVSTAPTARNWSYEKDGNVIGTIIDFDSFEHSQYGEQQIVIVSLADTNESISAFLNGYLQEGIRRKDAQAGDLILIQFLGKQPGERFNRLHLEIEKTKPNQF